MVVKVIEMKLGCFTELDAEIFRRVYRNYIFSLKTGSYYELLLLELSVLKFSQVEVELDIEPCAEGLEAIYKLNNLTKDY